MKKLTKNELHAIKEFKTRLKDRHPRNVIDLKLYGSKARGDAGPESDIDILIIVKERTAQFDDDTIDIVCDVLNEYDVYIETVTMSETSFQDAVTLQMPFVLNVVREAKAV